MQTVYIGIDPGVHGGLAQLTDNGVVESIIGMPTDMLDTWNWMAQFLDCSESSMACIELVGGYIPQTDSRPDSGKGNIGSAMFTFGHSAGSLHMAALAILGHQRIKVVPPAVWQRYCEVEKRRKGEARYSFKKRIKERAMDLFPAQHVTMETCDALLIAHYCRGRFSPTNIK